jgi:hypothetical protein
MKTLQLLENQQAEPPSAQPLIDRCQWLVVTLFALAMAWVEAAVVYYLRTLVDRIQPYQPNPLPIAGGLGMAELVREASTLVMLLTVGILAGKTWRSRLGYAALAFGIWDIFYYVFLKAMTGWPESLWDWDVLFLIPLPWWGPVLAPALIALLMVVWGSLVTHFESALPPEDWRVWLASAMGMAVALYCFMVDAWHASKGGELALRQMLPTQFDWYLFVIAIALMAAPILRILRQVASAPLPITATPAPVE